MFANGSPFANNKVYKSMIEEELKRSSKPITVCAAIPGFDSCQTKMVLGYRCGEAVDLTPSDMVEAKRRIEHEFLFIGISGEEEAAARLFYVMHGFNSSEPFLTPALHHYNRNPYNPKNINQQQISAKEDLLAYNWNDKHDMELYHHAESIFYTRCQQYNISTKYITEVDEQGHIIALHLNPEKVANEVVPTVVPIHPVSGTTRITTKGKKTSIALISSDDNLQGVTWLRKPKTIFSDKINILSSLS